METKLNYDDVCLIPEVKTTITSRSECNPYDEDGFLPIFAAPMASVVSYENIGEFNNSKIRTVIPRNISLEKRIKFLLTDKVNFVAFSLQEATDLFIKKNNVFSVKKKYKNQFRVCIDMANGHMMLLFDTIRKIKDEWGDRVLIMSGNIANPKTYEEYEKAGADYVRCSIGAGNACLSASNLGTFFPCFSLLKETYEIKEQIGGTCKIIADGGIKGYRDIQKALIYADYVMIGNLFNRALESAGETTYGKSYWSIRGFRILRPIKTLLTYGRKVPSWVNKDALMDDIKFGRISIWKLYFGMSTKLAQSMINEANNLYNKRLKTAEGLVKYQKVEYTIQGWAENETDYLRSSMSYNNSRNLEEYKNSQWVMTTKIAHNN